MEFSKTSGYHTKKAAAVNIFMDGVSLTTKVAFGPAASDRGN